MVILHIVHCACAIQPYFYFRSKIWRHHRVPWLQFPIRRRNFNDPRTFKADTGLLIFAWIFRTSWPKMGVWWQNVEGWCDVDPERTHFYFSGFLRLCQFWWKLITKCDCESARRQTDWQTQTDFVVCAMLYAIAMGEIIKIKQLIKITQLCAREGDDRDH